MTQNNELYHHGIPGMKWGVRRYQNKDGSLTSAGRKRAAKLEEKYMDVTGRSLRRKTVPTKTKSDSNKSKDESDKPKSIKDMSNEELRARYNRLQNERLYTEEMSRYIERNKSKGRKFIENTWDNTWSNIIVPATNEWAKKKTVEYLNSLTMEEDDDGKMTLKRKKNKGELNKGGLVCHYLIQQLPNIMVCFEMP